MVESVTSSSRSAQRGSEFMRSSGFLVRANRVTDGSAGPEHVVASEVVGVVVDVVIANFRTHKDVSPEVVANASAGVDQEMIRTDIIGATEIAAVVVRGIEARALPANTAE